MDENLRAQIDSNLSHLDALIKRGRRVCESLVADPSDMSALVANRAWQQDCGVAINQLSGGSKAHWLARAFSEAFLMRSPTGDVIDAVTPAEIAARLIAVLEQAIASLSQMGAGQVDSGSLGEAPAPHRFDFVHNSEIRPVVEQAYTAGRTALEQGSYGVALVGFCGILETIVTDALEYMNVTKLADASIPRGKVVDWPFEMRLAVAEDTGIIRGGCARLPDVAKKYREFADPAELLRAPVSEGDARRTMQVLHVVMRDLNPGR
jgi:hypothetical protein